jgi:hypothetical protein
VPPAVWGDWIKVKNRKHPAAMERVMEILKPRQAKRRPPAGALSWSVDDRRDRLSRHRQPKVLRTHSAIRAASRPRTTSSSWCRGCLCVTPVAQHLQNLALGPAAVLIEVIQLVRHGP